MIARSGYKLVERPDGATLFHRAEGPVTPARLLGDAYALAATLPAARHVLNLCRDRYAFTVTFLAALLRDQICLLTGERLPGRLDALAQRMPGCIAATDDPQQALPAGLPRHHVTIPADCRVGSPENPVIPADRLAAIVFTSGSTGQPVAHPKRWGALVERSIAAGIQFGLGEADPASVLGTVPSQHMYGFETTVLLPLHAAAASWSGPAFFPHDVHCGLGALPAPRILVTTPLQLRALLAGCPTMPSLRAVISATAPLEPSLAAAAETQWHVPVLEIFGATEVGSIASRRTLDGEAWSAYPGIRLVPVPPDGIAIAALHAETQPLDDRVERLGDNGFRLIGRRADIVKLGGQRASLAGLNRILLGLEGVEDGSFVLPDASAAAPQARLLALVVAPQRSASSILDELRGRIDPLFLPRRIIHVAAMPRNELGKLSHTCILALLGGAA